MNNGNKFLPHLSVLALLWPGSAGLPRTAVALRHLVQNQALLFAEQRRDGRELPVRPLDDLDLGCFPALPPLVWAHSEAAARGGKEVNQGTECLPVRGGGTRSRQTPVRPQDELVVRAHLSFPPQSYTLSFVPFRRHRREPLWHSRRPAPLPPPPG